MSTSEWENLTTYAKKVLRSEMGRNLVKTPELAEKLGVAPGVVRNKISRGTFSAEFFLRALQELGTKEVPVPPKEINKE